MVGAVAIGAFGAVIGLLVSYHRATATGATMALTTVVIFLVGLVAISAAGRVRRPAR
jgi:ABC-type Mn2+/Zn2+ transport system permease subunit